MHAGKLTEVGRRLLAVSVGLVLSVTMSTGGTAHAAEVSARPTAEFLSSIGIVSTFDDRGQPYAKTLEMLKYGGFRWLRGGIEGVSENGPLTIETFLSLHREAGVMISWGLGSGSGDLEGLIATGRILAEAGALLAFEGNNEPNNWPVVYKGQKGGGSGSWLPVAELQADLYRAVKQDPLLAAYPVWSISEPGAQTDNVGLQFLQIPQGAGTLMPDGTRFADYANVHNYIYHPNAPDPSDNKTWDAAEPGSTSPVDGLYGNFGKTWAYKYQGHTEDELPTLPRVTTETGVAIKGEVDEALQAAHLVNLYLAQFARGYSYTSVYLLRDRTDEQGNQTYGFFRPDYSPRTAAIHLHNLTSILADNSTKEAPDSFEYALEPQHDTVHDILLQHSDGTFQLVLWGEALEGENTTTIKLGRRVATATIYDPTTGTSPVAEENNVSEITLTLGNHPFVIMFR